MRILQYNHHPFIKHQICCLHI